MDRSISGYTDGDIDTNRSMMTTLNQLADERFSRRQTIVGSMKASAMAFLGTSLLAACGDEENDTANDPVVNAGTDVTTTTGNLVTLNGTSTGGPTDGTAFVQTGGPAVTLLTSTPTQISFIAPAVSAATPLTFQISNAGANDTSVVTVNPVQLSFPAVAKNLSDVVTVPTGYAVKVLTALGDPLTAATPAYKNDGTDTDFANRIGDHGDALYYYGLNAAGARDDNSNSRGLLVQNHENLSVQYLHPAGPTNVAAGPRPAAEAIKEIEAHGVSVMEVRDAAGTRDWAAVPASTFNRRLTPNTPMDFTGPVRGTAFLVTRFSTTGTAGRGTINNCANGHCLWGTLLTCEENWAGYFRRDNSGAGTDNAARSAKELVALRRYGVNSTTGNYAWSSATPTQDIFARWDARATGASATADYRNEPNHMGWVVEMDPYDPASKPRKRTALGRFGHEGAWLSRLIPGQRPAVYMGDDARREYFYKFVAAAPWEATDANRADRLAVGDKYLDTGTLYVAKFNADGTGQWLPLVFGQVPDRPAVGADPAYNFASQADILVNTRLAADALGATPMDRPEWTATNPVTGEIYLTLTNNNAAGRPLAGTDAANPRHYNAAVGSGTSAGNSNGHIIRIR
ncbi:MAG: alkaline phosphatase PhoX, partial [Pseudomonadota bacterium]